MPGPLTTASGLVRGRLELDAKADEGIQSKHFGDYELLEEIARGGMGVVYKARQKSLDRLVAVKVLLFGSHSSSEFIKRFRIEAAAGAALSHPNIVAIHEVGVHEGEHFLVMDYVDGPNLAQFIKDQPLPAKRTAQYLRTIAEAVHYAHEKGILHRDLKPSNVLIDSNDQPRVTDFGLAKRLDSSSWNSVAEPPLTQSGHVLGSPGYMPPEQAAGARGKISRRSDVYALGAMMYHLLTGRPPFTGESLPEVLHQVIQQEPVAPRLLRPTVPRDLEVLCLKCLEKDPQRRYATALELAEDLGRWQRLEPIQARPAGVAFRSARWVRRNPIGVALITFLTLALGLSLALLKLVNDRAGLETVRATHQIEANSHMRTRLRQTFEELWRRSDKDSESIRSEELAALAGMHKGLADSNAVRLIVGVSATENPMRRAERYQPLLESLESGLETILRQQTRLDLELCKSRLAADMLAAGKLQLARMGALSYLKARRMNPGIHLIAQVNAAKDAVIFARRSLGITNILGLRGRSVVFADTNSTLSLLAKFHLLEAGIRGVDLSRYAQIDSDEMFERKVQLGGAQEDQQVSGHSEAIKAVLAGEFDAGVARVPGVAEFLGTELVALHYFEGTPNVWVASAEVPPELMEALRAAFLSLPPKVLSLEIADFPTRKVFDMKLAVNQAQIDELERALTKTEALFDAPRSDASQSLGGTR